MLKGGLHPKFCGVAPSRVSQFAKQNPPPAYSPTFPVFQQNRVLPDAVPIGVETQGVKKECLLFAGKAKIKRYPSRITNDGAKSLQKLYPI